MVRALLDSNVIIAALAGSHEHHAPSLALFTGHRAGTFAVAAHSYAECYATLTRREERSPFRFSAEEAWAALESVAAVTALTGLTPAQTFAAVRDFSGTGSIGPRLDDLLIGECAIVQGIPAILTWNVGRMQGLFPALEVIHPPNFA